MQFRDFEMGDLDECTRLLLCVYERDPWNDAWPNVETARQYLLEFAQNPSFMGQLAIDENRIAGASFGHKRTWWQGAELYIDEFYIHPDLQRRGIGKALMNHIKSELTRLNIHAMALLTERGYPSEAFYRREGFVIRKSTQFMISEFLA